MFSDYAYRLVPASIQTDMNVGVGRPYPRWYKSGFGVYGTRPIVYTHVGAPLFKSQKQLGGRAVVADSFGRGAGCDRTHVDRAYWVGDGYYAHKKGYNVLYGDWHARWFGDANGRFMWWPNHFGWESTPAILDTGGKPWLYLESFINTQTNVLATPLDGQGYRLIYRVKDKCFSTPIDDDGPFAWHILDTAAGLDVGAEEGLGWITPDWGGMPGQSQPW